MASTLNLAGENALPVEQGDDGFAHDGAAPGLQASGFQATKTNASALRALMADKLEAIARKVDVSPLRTFLLKLDDGLANQTALA